MARWSNSAWSTGAAPEYPVAMPVCEFVEPCPTEMFMRQQLHEAWTLTKETIEGWVVLRARRALPSGVEAAKATATTGDDSEGGQRERQ